MPAYLIARVRVDDPETYLRYTKVSKPLIESHGGRFLARGGETEILEGQDDTNRLVLVRFPDMAAARAWYRSEQYQRAKEIRSPISEATFTLIEGV